MIGSDRERTGWIHFVILVQILDKCSLLNRSVTSMKPVSRIFAGRLCDQITIHTEDRQVSVD
jgi:hypothetical protein